MWDLRWTKWHWDRFFPEYFGFPVNFIPPVLHYLEKRKILIFITGLHNKPQGCGASVASAAGPFKKKGPSSMSCLGETIHLSSATGRTKKERKFNQTLPKLTFHFTVQSLKG
jgi:hypothetical protein